jgi:GT2 family glycosyltransferase
MIPETAKSEMFISVVIPSLRDNADLLQKSLQHQTYSPDLIQIVHGVRPNGRARNIGVSAATDQARLESDQEMFLVFIDDDAMPGDERLIEGLIKPLVENSDVGITGAARVLPKNASWFQRRVAAEIPRTVNQIPDTPLETNPPLRGYGHSLITTTCCAMRQIVFDKVGGFSEKLISGVDTDFFYRVRGLGYRFIMAPSIYVEHPAPDSLPELVRKFYWYGIGYGQETQRRPQQKMGPRLSSRIHRILFLVVATLWLIPNIFILYSFGYPNFRLGFRPLKALSTYAVAWGYVRGWERNLA